MQLRLPSISFVMSMVLMIKVSFIYRRQKKIRIADILD